MSFRFEKQLKDYLTIAEFAKGGSKIHWIKDFNDRFSTIVIENFMNISFARLMN